MQHTIPNLVVEVLPEPPAPLEQRLELGRLRVANQCRHLLKATAGPGTPIRFAHDSSIAERASLATPG